MNIPKIAIWYTLINLIGIGFIIFIIWYCWDQSQPIYKFKRPPIVEVKK